MIQDPLAWVGMGHYNGSESEMLPYGRSLNDPTLPCDMTLLEAAKGYTTVMKQAHPVRGGPVADDLARDDGRFS